MITHNGKQVTLAMRNRKAINLIARNGKAMFGEFSAISFAAKAVILAEYGKQVWSDVRDYAIAHPQIVEFINQDPHLAASISPNSNKERWLVGDGKAYINTGIVPTATTGVKTKIKHKQSIYNSFVFSAGGLDDRYAMYEQNNALVIWYVPNSYTATNVVCNKNLVVEYNINKAVRILDEQGSLLYSKTLAQKDCTAPLRTGSSLSQYPTGVDDYAYLIMEDADGIVANLLPCLYNGIAGMVDAISGTFHPNANTQGQFTIAVTDKE